LIAGSCPLTTDETVTEANPMMIKMLIREIRPLNRSIDEYDKRIKEAFKEHPDAFIFKSFPGAGQQQAPRLLTAFGDDRSRYESAVNVSSFIGVAPVIERSGKQVWIRWRWHAPGISASKRCGICRLFYSVVPMGKNLLRGTEETGQETPRRCPCIGVQMDAHSVQMLARSSSL